MRIIRWIGEQEFHFDEREVVADACVRPYKDIASRKFGS